MNKPRILLVTHYYEAHRGGVEIVAWRIAARLAARGYSVTWAASDIDPTPSATPGMRFCPMQAMNGIEARLGIPYPIWTRDALNQLKSLVNESDVVHVHDSLYQGNVFAAKQASKMVKPYVVTQHIGFVPYKNPMLRSCLTLANRLVALPTLESAHSIAFISENTMNYFKGLGLKNRHSNFVPNGVDTEMYRPNLAGKPSDYGLDPNRPIALFVGRFVEKKGLPMLRKIAEAMPEVQWVLAGWGPIEPMTWGLANVIVLDNLSGPTLAPLYGAADLLVMPSVGEGFPLVVQEAMACGLSVMVAPETAQAYSPAAPLIYTAPIDSVDAWIQEIKRLVADRKTLRQSNKTLSTFARDHWSWDRCVDKYEEMILSTQAGNKQ